MSIEFALYLFYLLFFAICHTHVTHTAEESEQLDFEAESQAVAFDWSADDEDQCGLNEIRAMESVLQTSGQQTPLGRRDPGSLLPRTTHQSVVISYISFY